MTILICARDAATTIERAVISCLPENVPILLIDDHSRDDTVARARAAAGERLRVIAAPATGGIGVARQAGLDAVETEFAGWLDADDAWIPGRVARLVAALRDGAEIATEAIDLHDGTTGSLLRRLEIPSFLREPRAAVRLFERNFLPGDTQVAFRVSTYRAAGGYDPAVFGVESYDLLLRSLRRGARLACGEQSGYRMYAYSGSVSRDLVRQRASLAQSLAKHDYASVRQLYTAAGYGGRIAAWAIVSMALFRGDFATALSTLDEASPPTADSRQVLEPAGPWPFEEGWRRAFQRGTILLLLHGRDSDAAAELERAETIEPTAEGANNRGVALARLGRQREAAVCFADALKRFPNYSDAAQNAVASVPCGITTHPLRRQPSRSEYPTGPK